jgi:hypothetical protein
MPTLKSMKGEVIVVSLTSWVIEQKNSVIVTKLVEVENAGIWIEGRDLAKMLHNEKKLSIIPEMPLFFVPFAQIAWIHGSAEYPSLSEEHLGV